MSTTNRHLAPDAKSRVMAVSSLVTKSSGLSATCLMVSSRRRYKLRAVTVKVIQAFATNSGVITLGITGDASKYGSFTVTTGTGTAGAILTFENFTLDELAIGDELLIAQAAVAGNGTYFVSVEMYPYDESANGRGV